MDPNLKSPNPLPFRPSGAEGLGVARFGAFELDPAGPELYRNRVRVALQPQPMRVLLSLVLRAGETVRREALQEEIWGDTFVEPEAGLNVCIRQIRAALGDRADRGLFIQTIRGEGYRFVAPVRWQRAGAAAREPRRGLRSRAKVLGLAASGLAAALLLAWGLGQGLPSFSAETQRAERRQPSPEARQALLKGRYHLNQQAPGSLGRAVEHLERAVHLDPTSAEAQVELATAIASCPFGSFGGPEVVRALVDTALDLDQDLPRAYLLRGNLEFFTEWDWDAAQAAYQRALELDPELARAHKGLAFYHSSLGQHERALERVQQALEIDPISVNLKADLGWFLYRARRFSDAQTQCRETLDLEPGDPGALSCLAAAAAEIEPPATVWTYTRAMLEAYGFDPDHLAELTRLAERDPALALGRYQDWILQWHQRRAARGEADAYAFAVAHAQQGHADEALTWLEVAYRERSASMPFLGIDPGLDGVRDHPRFTRLLALLRLPEKAGSEAAQATSLDGAPKLL